MRNKEVKKEVKKDEEKLERQVIEDVKKILESGNEGIIKTMKLNIKAYMYCIEINQRGGIIVG